MVARISGERRKRVALLVVDIDFTMCEGSAGCAVSDGVGASSAQCGEGVRDGGLGAAWCRCGRGAGVVWWLLRGSVAAYPAMDVGVVVGWSALPLTVVLGVLLGWAERSKPGEGGPQAPIVSVSNSPGGRAQVDGDVTNTISGGTQHGPLLQGRDFTGLSFGTPIPSAPPAGRPEEGGR